jgi:hypothetical protein
MKLARIFMATGILTILSACGSTAEHPTHASAQKSVVDARGRVFGLITTGKSSSGEELYEFRYCRQKILPKESLSNENVCINPYVDQNGHSLVLTGKIVNDAETLASELKRTGYLKGTAVAVPAAVGSAFLVLTGIGAVEAGGALVSQVALVLGSGNPFVDIAAGYMLVGGGGAAAGGGAAGFLGFQIWGKSDRQAAQNIPAAVGDFYSAKNVESSLVVVQAIADGAHLKIKEGLNRF